MAELADSKERGEISSSAGSDSFGTGSDPSEPEQSPNSSAKMGTGIPKINLGSIEIKSLGNIFSH